MKGHLLMLKSRLKSGVIRQLFRMETFDPGLRWGMLHEKPLSYMLPQRKYLFELDLLNIGIFSSFTPEARFGCGKSHNSF